MRNIKVIFLVAAMPLLTGCVSTRHAPEMREIQQTHGAYTQSLWYLGSTRTYHYFDQSRRGLFSKKETFKRFRVPFPELLMPENLVFPYEPTLNKQDDKRDPHEDGVEAEKVRISSGPPYVVARREPLSTKAVRKLNHVNQALKIAVRGVNETLMLLSDLRLPLSDLASSYKKLHNRWPTSVEELKNFAIASDEKNELMDWSSCEKFGATESDDGSLVINFSYKGVPFSITISSSVTEKGDQTQEP